MAFIVKRKILTLQFEEGHDLFGATVRCRSASLGTLMEVGEEAELARTGGGAVLSRVRDLLTVFTDRIESWDLADEDGTEIPPTVDGLLMLDADVALDLVLTWVDVIMSVKGDRDLGKDSTSGEPFPEALLPMAVA